MADRSRLQSTGIEYSQSSVMVGELLQLGATWLGVWAPAIFAGWLVAETIALLPLSGDPQATRVWSIAAGGIAWLATLLTLIWNLERGGPWGWLPRLFSKHYLIIALAIAFAAGAFIPLDIGDARGAKFVARACNAMSSCVSRAEQLAGDESPRDFIARRLP